MGWLDGALRIMPSWEFAGLGHTIPFEVFLPAVVFPGLIFTICLLWPALERKVTGDNELHNLLDRPRDRPKRTAAGAAMFALLFTLFAPARPTCWPTSSTSRSTRCCGSSASPSFVIPIIAGLVTYQLCREMQGVHGHRQAQAGRRRAAARPRASTRTVPTPPRPTTCTPSSTPSRCRCASTSSRWATVAPVEPESSPTGVRQVTR